MLYCNNAIGIGGHYIGKQKADLLATLYDVGGIIGELLMIMTYYFHYLSSSFLYLYMQVVFLLVVYLTSSMPELYLVL